MSSSVGMIIPKIWKVIKAMFQSPPTRYYFGMVSQPKPQPHLKKQSDELEVTSSIHHLLPSISFHFHNVPMTIRNMSTYFPLFQVSTLWMVNHAVCDNPTFIFDASMLHGCWFNHHFLTLNLCF